VQFIRIDVAIPTQPALLSPTVRNIPSCERDDGRGRGEQYSAIAQGNASKEATVKILEYKEMEPSS
jgi:hypothetical protein